MPARRLPSGPPEPVPKFAVVGQYVTEAGSRFVRHVAILREESRLHYGCPNTLVWHMHPPLIAGGISSVTARPDQNTCDPHLIGIINLDTDDIECIETWLAEVDTERRPDILMGYVVRPAMEWVTAENNVRQYRRFSCVGFVLECYRSVEVNLLDDSEPSRLPEADLETVATAYDGLVSSEFVRERVGIPGQGPWRIALAGYLFHSLERESEEIRSTVYLPADFSQRHYP